MRASPPFSSIHGLARDPCFCPHFLMLPPCGMVCAPFRSLPACTKVEPPEKEFMVCSLDVLSSMAEGLGQAFEPLVASSNLVSPLLQVRYRERIYTWRYLAVVGEAVH